MSKKKLLAINLNEFNLKYLNYGSKKYNCKSLSIFLKFNKIQTFSNDKIQDKNLDPWVQSISINSGFRSKKHRIFNLGENIPKDLIQIWDLLSEKKLFSAVWGPMNTHFKNNNFIKLFFPDPWNHQNLVKPIELKNINNLARFYAQNYTRGSKKIKLSDLFKTFFYILKKGIFLKLIKKINIFFPIILKKGFKNYILFFLFDIISLLIFENLTKNKKINFSLIFLNSLAHFQHNNWDDKSKERDYFIFTDYIINIIFALSKNYDSLIIYNGFSQKKINTQYMIRPSNPKRFLESYGIQFINFRSNMTNGAIITFKNHKLLHNELIKLKSINLKGFKLFEIKVLNNLQIFYRIQIRSKTNKVKDLKKNIMKNFFYENKNSLLKKNINNNIDKFLDEVSFIKTTSNHIPEGELLFKNMNIEKKRIENIKIFELIKNYF